ncbi:MAG: hypothetical protein ACD_45C00678G0003 [uncultured bacterium]|nr:MAG: hypothetical protein ACD_45C00678G0003 [uncultured bacterium]
MENSTITHTSAGLIIPMTFLVAFILTLLPMPDWAIWLRPAWVLMVLIYWAMMAPHQVNVGVAWLVGLFLDVLNGTLLGEHALAMTLAIYVVIKIHSRLRMWPLLQQGLSVFFLVLFYQFILFCVQGFLGQPPSSWLYWSSSLTSMLLWPWMFSIIRRRI